MPIFPAEVVISTSAEELSPDAVRYVIAFETPLQAVEVIGFYRDVPSVAGWQLTVDDVVSDASAAPGIVALTVSDGVCTRAVLQLD